MSKVRISTFEELAIEFTRQLDGSSKLSIKETKRVDIETTDSIVCNIMPCSFPNPEQLLSNREERFGRMWDNNLNIQGSRASFIATMLKKSYA